VFHSATNCFKHLLLRGAFLEEHEYGRHPTCHFAIAGGNLELVRILEQKDVNFGGALQIAALFHRHEIFEWILATRNPNLNEVDITYDANLHQAAVTENFHPLLVGLPLGLDVNLADRFERTLLYMAAMEEHPDVIRFLLSVNGIDINKPARGVSPLSIACKRGNCRVVELLLQQQNLDVNFASLIDRTALHNAVRKGGFDIVVALLKIERLNVNARDKNGLTALHFAAQNADSRMLSALLEKDGIEINPEDMNGRTPLYFAVKSHCVQNVEVLLRCALVEVNPPGCEKKPIHEAIEHGPIDLVRLLLSQDRVDVNAIDGFVPSKFIKEHRCITQQIAATRKSSSCFWKGRDCKWGCATGRESVCDLPVTIFICATKGPHGPRRSPRPKDVAQMIVGVDCLNDGHRVSVAVDTESGRIEQPGRS
jgi:ankyrin repeat protein